MADRALRPFDTYWRLLEGGTDDEVVAGYALVKLAARCNIACTYCYWFRDRTVYEKPKTLTPEAEAAFLDRLREHITHHKVPAFFLLFHGGEPLLFGKARFNALCTKLRSMEKELGVRLQLAVTTNGMLIDDEWAAILRAQRVGVTVSIDGPEHVHDRFRVDFRNRGTFQKTMLGVDAIRRAGIEPGFLAVGNPFATPAEILRFFVDEVGATEFDVLVPDATHEDRPPSIAAYYIDLFDLWYDHYWDRGVRIRFLETLVRGVLGSESHVESIGYGPNTTFTLLTDGSLEPLDVLRTVGDSFTRTSINVFQSSLQDIQKDPLWREILRSSLELPEVCRGCVYRHACGGGHIGQRWSKARRFDNPSVYCEDIKQILGHVWRRVTADVTISVDPASIAAIAALDAAQSSIVTA